MSRAPDRSPIAWMKHHVHAEGPFCWVLRRPRRLIEPLRYRGLPGFFDVPEELLAGASWERQCRVCRCTDLDGCRGGCAWVEEDLCSRCVGG